MLSDQTCTIHGRRISKIAEKLPHVCLSLSLRTRNISAPTGVIFIYEGLSPCDFDLIPKMKEPLRGIRFRTIPEIIQAVDRSIRTMNTTGAAKGILRLPHRWQRVVHNVGKYIEG